MDQKHREDREKKLLNRINSKMELNRARYISDPKEIRAITYDTEMNIDDFTENLTLPNNYENHPYFFIQYCKWYYIFKEEQSKELPPQRMYPLTACDTIDMIFDVKQLHNQVIILSEKYDIGFIHLKVKYFHSSDFELIIENVGYRILCRKRNVNSESFMIRLDRPVKYIDYLFKGNETNHRLRSVYYREDPNDN